MSIKQSILFGLTLFDEVLREFRDPGGVVSFSYENLYGFVPESYKRKNLYSIVHKLKTEENIHDNSRGSFKLDLKGKEIIKDSFPFFKFLNYSWDGKWRIVGFDIEEENRSLRSSLRSFLHKFRFGMFQRSLYISPLPIEAEVENFISLNREFLPNTYIFISDDFFVGNKDVFIDKVFKINQLNNQYKQLLQKIRNGIENKTQVVREFLEISLKDPFLPKELLPINFSRDEVWKKLGTKGFMI